MNNNDPINIIDRLQALGSSILGTLMLLGISLFIHFLIARNSVRKKTQGAPICFWVPAMYLAGSCIGIWQAYNRISLFEMPGGFGGFGILVGLIFGHIHGAINLTRHQPLGTDCMSTRIDSSENPVSLLENPYKPPTHVT